MSSDEKFEYPFAEGVFPCREELKAIPKIRGMREWINEKSEILFVAQQLPLEGDGQPIFGKNTRKMIHAMFKAGLLEETYDTPWKAELEIFGMQGFSREHLYERYPWSIVSWSDIPFYKTATVQGRERSYGICCADWTRILDMLEPLQVKKVAVLGKKMIREANRWMKGDHESPAKYGFLWHHEHKGYSVPFYGLPITAINEKAVAYYQILKELDRAAREQVELATKAIPDHAYTKHRDLERKASSFL